MKNIHVHIDRLVLDGLPLHRSDGEAVGRAIEHELARLLGENDAFAGAGGSVAFVDGGSIWVGPDRRPSRLGARIGEAVHGVLRTASVVQNANSRPMGAVHGADR